jgi:hypothetical protein
MNLKAKLIILSDKLDKLGLLKDADIIDLLLKKSSEEKDISKILNEEVDNEEPAS